jgi:hypothetical protein
MGEETEAQTDSVILPRMHRNIYGWYLMLYVLAMPALLGSPGSRCIGVEADRPTTAQSGALSILTSCSVSFSSHVCTHCSDVLPDVLGLQLCPLSVTLKGKTDTEKFQRHLSEACCPSCSDWQHGPDSNHAPQEGCARQDQRLLIAWDPAAK